MAMIYRCHTCGQRYECNARYCPGCGKKLGHKTDPRLEGAILEYDEHALGTWYRCSVCSHMTEGEGYRYCPQCGAPVTGYRIRSRRGNPFAIAKQMSEETGMSLSDALKQAMEQTTVWVTVPPSTFNSFR